MNENVTITEEYTLPSKGMLYGKPFDPVVKLRSMTVAEELKRLSPAKNVYKVMSDIIEDCLLTKLPISVYDLCFGDYVYLLQKLRIVTYGNDYPIKFVCPQCGEIESSEFNLDNVTVNEYSNEIKEMMEITLPVTGKKIGLRFQTPRDLDNINSRAEELRKRFPDMTEDPKILLTLESFINTIDGAPVDKVMIGEALKTLPLKDYNYLEKKALKLNGKVGIDSIINLKCNHCGNDVKSVFRYTDEFFRPEVD